MFEFVSLSHGMQVNKILPISPNLNHILIKRLVPEAKKIPLNRIWYIYFSVSAMKHFQ